MLDQRQQPSELQRDEKNREVVKREVHRLALLQAVISGSPKFFLGTDSAPHLDHDKESSCGCAGCFTAPNTLELLAHIFEEQKAFHMLALFMGVWVSLTWNILPMISLCCGKTRFTTCGWLKPI